MKRRSFNLKNLAKIEIPLVTVSLMNIMLFPIPRPLKATPQNRIQLKSRQRKKKRCVFLNLSSKTRNPKSRSSTSISKKRKIKKRVRLLIKKKNIASVSESLKNKMLKRRPSNYQKEKKNNYRLVI